MTGTTTERPRGSVGVAEPDYRLTEPLDPDLAGVFRDLPADAREYRDRARRFVQDEVLPVIDAYWDRAEYPLHLVRRLGELDLLRDGIDVPGFARQSLLAACLVQAELTRGDGSVGVMLAVQGGLTMRTISMLGSPEQRERWLGPLARGEELGAFALTEPTHGSDSVALETTATSVDGGFVLNGEKKWIGNGGVGGVTVVWARGDDGAVHAFLVPQSTPGYRAETITGKVALRAIWQTHVRLDDVFVPADARLPGANTFKDTSRILVETRLGVAWSALGHATACYEAAVHYAGQRQQFGRPLAAAQIVQERLARMASELTQLQTLLMALTTLAEDGALRGPQASLAKYSATRTARSIAADARDLLGGNGILLRNRVARHFADIEATHTYEGTETVQALILGREITGRSAFA
ncbi:acyl-CoA dehydrogenase family protein [Herbiconiux sp. SYSU D00978]|uniref:acyl-CoA dehydrogenase family protein n=1 Tax=Herbiconiux sp. SYSU D00978 TaxID=2812562 RepID=UPI001A968ABB|nr:acyl-CoA dehydrogenase family protein [Herbiconiux sp. SYSU D00978]